MSFTGHIGVFGQTGTGKTTLVNAYCNQYKRNGINVVVLDPNFDINPYDFRTDKFDDFINVVKNSQQCLIVVDESGDNLRWGDDRVSWLGKKSRHWGHRLLLSSQRPVDITTQVRSQLGVIHAFYLLEKDAKAVNEVSSIPWRNIVALSRYEFYTYRRFKKLKKQKLKLD